MEPPKVIPPQQPHPHGFQPLSTPPPILTATCSPGKKRIQFSGQPFYLDQHYQINKLIGRGTYGIVAKGFNRLTTQQVAIKKMSQLFDNLKDTKRILREIRILKFLKNKNIIELIDIMTIDDPSTFNEVYLVFELMTSNLAHVINTVKLTFVQIKVLIYRLLSGLYYMHSANIIHRDLKPDNLLVNKKCQLKIGDLNLATKYEEEEVDQSHTEYVSTRWYRAPEVLLFCSNYNSSIDIWSVGCILAELIGKVPLFRGQDYLDQFSRIAAIMGIPDENDFEFEKGSSAAYNLNGLLNQIKKGPQKQVPGGQPQAQTQSQWNGVNWNEFFGEVDPLCVDLLSHMLVYNPKKRYTAEECLKHPLFQDIYEKLPPEKCEQEIDWTLDHMECSQEEMRAMFVKEINDFRNNLGKKQTTLKRQHEGGERKTEDVKRIKKQPVILITNTQQKQKEKKKQQQQKIEKEGGKKDQQSK